MGQSPQFQITPAPSDEEAAALAVALSAYLAATRAAQPPPLPQHPTLGYRRSPRQPGTHLELSAWDTTELGKD